MPDMLYPPSAAAAAAGISKSSIRNHVNNPHYRMLFSEDARRVPRYFSEDDVRLLRYIGEQTRKGRTHADIAEAIAAGALAGYDWQPPQPHEQPTQEETTEEQPSALVLVADLQRRQSELYERLLESETGRATAEAQVDELRRLVDELRAQLAAGQQPKPGLIARLLGRK